MRSKEEVMNSIYDMVDSDDNIRAAIINGSRVNPNIKPDLMQDYDVVLFLNHFDELHYKIKRKWIQGFGNLVIMQQNDFEDGSYIFLMQFQDGVRIDLRFCPLNLLDSVIEEDSLTQVLVDKDGIIGDVAEASDNTYWVQKPSELEWDKLLNEAWWIQTYVAKGIWRDELPLVKYMYDVILVGVIHKLLSWYIGEQHDWEVNVGKCGKFYKTLLSDELYMRFTDIYCNADYSQIWSKLEKSGRFIRLIGNNLADSLGYKYPELEDTNVTEYINRIRKTPRDSSSLED